MAKIFLVRCKDHPAGHAYCIWETAGTLYGYDRNGESFPILTYSREPKAIAATLATGQSKALNEELTVAGRVYRAEKSQSSIICKRGGFPTRPLPASEKNARTLLTARSFA